MDDRFEAIARAIGHHFWTCADDTTAINCGASCAHEVLAALDDLPHPNLTVGVDLSDEPQKPEHL